MGEGANGRGEIPEYRDEMQHIGWRWVCPVCGKEVRTIYYPVPVRTLFDAGEFTDPVIAKRLCDADLPQAPVGMFACWRCHDVCHFSSISKNAWNQVVSYLTAGMLYGSEVERPESFVGQRKRTRIRVLNREAPLRRKVLTRLRNGWSDFQIARDLQLTRNAVGLHVMVICREEGVVGRRALARKLGFAEPPLSVKERAKARRELVVEMLMRDCGREEMREALGVDLAVLADDIGAIYKMHGLVGRKHGGRRALAEKMGKEFVGSREKQSESGAEIRGASQA